MHVRNREVFDPATSIKKKELFLTVYFKWRVKT